MVIIKHILNRTTEVNPLNRNDVYIEVNYDQQATIDQVEPHVSIGNLYFAREDVALFRSFIDAGINGTGPGIFEGVPYDIHIQYPDGHEQVLNYYVDLSDGLKISKDGVQVSLKQYQGLDWINDRIDGFTFDSIYNASDANKALFESKYVYIPYVINTVPQYGSAFMALTSITVMYLQLTKEVIVIVEKIIEAVQIDVVGIATKIIGIVVEIFYAVSLLASLGYMMADFVLLIIQPIKYQVGMYVSDLLEIACSHLGIDFSSTVWQTYPLNSWVIIPERYNLIESDEQYQVGGIQKIARIVVDVIIGIGLVVTFMGSGLILLALGLATGALQNLSDTIVNFGAVQFLAKIQGFTSITMAQNNHARGYPMITGGDLLALAKKIINGKIVIKNGTLFLEQRDYNLSSALYQLPPVRKDWIGYNTHEFNSTTLISFAKDLNDKNVIDKYMGTSYEVVQVPTVVNDQSLVSTKGFKRIDLGYARGINKTENSFPEEMMLAGLKVFNDVSGFMQETVDVVTDVINGILDFVSDVSNIITNTLSSVFNFFIDILNDLLDPIGISIPHVTLPSWVGDIILVMFSLAIGGGAIGILLSIFAVVTPSIGSIDIPTSEDLLGTQARINALLLENDMVDTPKIVMINTPDVDRLAYLHPDNLAIVRAKYIYDRFYSSDQWVPNQYNEHSQYEIISPALNKPGDGNKIPFTGADYELCLTDNKILDDQAEPALLESLQWYIEQGWAMITYRKKRIYTNNLTLKTSEPSGY